jgi:hypothetical protein
MLPFRTVPDPVSGATMQSSLPRAALIPLLVLLAVFHACGDSTAPAEPAAVHPLSEVELVVGAGATETVAVRVTDARGRPLSSIAVEWSSTTPGGSVSPRQSRTDEAGETRTAWTVGSAAGSHTLLATVAGLPPVSMTATVRVGAPASMAAHGTHAAAGVVATVVEPAPAVVVRDAQGAPIQGVPVTFAIGSGFGTVSGAQQATNVDGVAAVGGWTLGNVAIPNTVTATAAGLPPVTFTVVATAGAPGILRVRSGAEQSGIAANITSEAPSVWVQDAHRNAVSGAVVEFAVTGGGGSLTGAHAVSNAYGIATVGSWKLGPAAGPNSVTATVAGVEPVEFTATARPPAAAAVIIAGNAQTAAAGTAVPVAPAVRVLDEAGAPVVGAVADFAVVAGGGMVIGAQATTGADGVARAGNWFLGDIGPNALTATVGLLPPLSFTAEALDPAEHLELAIEAVHLNQGNQTLHGTAGVIAGRAGILRIVARANATNPFTPPVLVRLYQGATLIREELLAAPAAGVPTHPDLAELRHTWNLALPAADVVPGLAVEVVLDPHDVLRVRTPGDKRFPRGGGAASLDVAVLHPLRVVFFPVHAAAHQLTGDVTTSNMDAYLPVARQWLPVAQIVPRVDGTFTTGLDLSEASNWSRLIAEIQAKRTLEGARDEYYHGIVPFFTGTPWGGYAYIPAHAGSVFRSGITYDRFPIAAEVFAHEIGHNLGRRHAPCGNVIGPDPAFPHPNARLGSPGFDIASGELVAGHDLRDYMSYCGPKWPSDYTFDATVRWRRADPLAVPASGSYPTPGTLAASGTQGAATDAARRGILVWGRIHDGGVELNPAFALSARPSLPDGPGGDVMRGTDAAGREIFRFSFEGVRVDHSNDASERHFVFFVPLSERDIAELATLEVIAAGGARAAAVAGSASDAAVVQDPAMGGRGEVRIDRAAGDRLRLTWNAADHPMALVRDPHTGAVLGFARAGDALVSAGGRTPDGVEVLLSDGVRSSRAVRRDAAQDR